MAPNGVQKVLASWLAGSVTQYVVAVVLGITGNPERHKLLNETGGPHTLMARYYVPT